MMASFQNVTGEKFTTTINDDHESKDEVDFIPTAKNVQYSKDANHNLLTTPSPPLQFPPLTGKKSKQGTLYGDCEVKNTIKSGLTTLEKFSFFTMNRKSSKEKIAVGTDVPPHRKHTFVKSASLARLLGNTYNTKKFENELRKYQLENQQITTNGGTTVAASKKPTCPTERFHKKMENSFSADSISLNDFQENSHNKDLGAKAFRTISRGLGKLWWKKTHSVEISTPDPEFKVSYLGNVLTGWAKGEGCVEKPLNTLWRNYTQNNKPDVVMRVRICASGLKATTRQHGLTEYWANRITHCCAPKNFPRVFCWIYRHEGRKLKHELRCHAVLCSKESIAQDICNTLRDNLTQALRDFKREKILRQNARLSLANAAYENPSLPKRRILLSVGGNNYRPPLERSKSAPKLMAIEEAIGEEDGEEIEETNEPEMRPCCQKDSLYPAMTLGRRRCRRGHSIRRTGQGVAKSALFSAFNTKQSECCATKEISATVSEKTKSNTSLGSNSDEDELDKLLSYHDYDKTSPLAGELMSYFDMKLHKASSLTNLNETEEVGVEEDEDHPIDPNPCPKLRASLSLDMLDNCSEDGHGNTAGSSPQEFEEIEDYESDDLYYRQAAILNLLHRSSLRKMADLSLESEQEPKQRSQHQQQLSLDSDEGSISSGCETASTVTTNNEDVPLKQQAEQESVTPPVLIQRPTSFVKTIKFNLSEEHISRKLDTIKRRTHTGEQRREDGSDSDESGYVEFQDGKSIITDAITV